MKNEITENSRVTYKSTIIVLFLLLGVITKLFLDTNIMLYVFILGILIYCLVVKELKFNSHQGFIFILIIVDNLLLVCIYPQTSMKYFIVQCISFFSLVLLQQLDLKQYEIGRICKNVSIFYWCYFCIFILMIIMGRVTGSGGTFAFGIYQLILALSYFAILGVKFKTGAFLSAFVMCFLSGDRSNAVTLLVMMLIYQILTRIKLSKLLYNSIYWIVSLLCMLYPVAYIGLYKSQYAYSINMLFYKYTNEFFFSGRHNIWLDMFKSIEQNPIIGNGLEGYVYRGALSAHNTYLQVLYNSGVIGLILFCLFFYCVWYKLYKYLYNDAVRLSATFLLGMIIISMNSVIIVGTDILFTIYMYIAIAMGCISVKNEEMKKGS